MAALGACLFVAPASVSPASAKTHAAATHAVTLVENGTPAKFETPAATVEQFLRERKIAPADGDILNPARGTALADGMTIEYRIGTTYRVLVDGKETAVTTVAQNVSDVLAAAHVQLGPLDEVEPAPSQRAAAENAISVTHVSAWNETQASAIPRRTEQRLEATVAPGRTQVLEPGADGVKETVYHFEQRGTDPPVRTLVGTRIARAPKTRVVVRGLGEYEAFAELAREGISTTLSIAGTALRMIATAYIPQCYGCSGITKTGLPAGHGVVAVDPRVIPLGTKLYIPGYGHAVAGDVGSAINGRRIDLGFNHLGDALRFGRREITVYIVAQ